MDTLQFFLTIITDHFQFEVEFLLMGVIAVYLGKQTHRVPDFRPLISSSTDGHSARNSVYVIELADLGFKRVEKYDVTMNPAVPMFVDVFLSSDQLSVATIVRVRSSTGGFSFVEFHTNLSPHGNITTNNSNNAGIFYKPPWRMVAKVPWRKNVADILGLHLELCEAAKDHSFMPMPIKPEEIRDCYIRCIRAEFDDQVDCGRLVKVSADAYRATFKGALLFVPLVWHKQAYGWLHNLSRPSNQAFCKILGRRLEKARSGSGAVTLQQRRI